ncbi:hypothetical protein DNHGIG_15210 [Collibacillus ludicampi]|uniref:Uncharacterized protein n=1 Tax=Collibacillus ludicampi TaxID=2771369 RepID=A0AAV4LEV3_9BACL|nr:hypothetical protein [Collibacillus ludicampi]GIM45972.1 hypothetical protein DNHGIG_15210 [Collibacillus ludicampi]
MYKIVPLVNGVLDLDYSDIIQAIDNGDGTAIVHVQDTTEPRQSWRDATEQDWQNALSKVPQPIQPPDPSQLLGQFLVEQALKNAELEQALNAIGAGIVQLQLKGGA